MCAKTNNLIFCLTNIEVAYAIFLNLGSNFVSLPTKKNVKFF